MLISNSLRVWFKVFLDGYKFSFFDDFNATSNTSSGENHRSLNNVLFFFLNYHKGTFLADTIFLIPTIKQLTTVILSGFACSF
jgi:hypothetical protein